jgi:hypothetical protein
VNGSSAACRDVWLGYGKWLNIRRGSSWRGTVASTTRLCFECTQAGHGFICTPRLVGRRGMKESMSKDETEAKDKLTEKLKRNICTMAVVRVDAAGGVRDYTSIRH